MTPPKSKSMKLPKCRYRITGGLCRKCQMVTRRAYRKCWLVLKQGHCPEGHKEGLCQP